MDYDTLKDAWEDLMQERGELYERVNSYMVRIQGLEAEVKRLEQELARHA